MGSSSAFLIQLHGLLRLGAPPSCQRIWALPGCLGIKYPKTTALLTALPLYRTYAAKKYRTRREKAIIFSRFKQQNPPVHSSIRPTGAFTTCFSPRYSRGGCFQSCGSSHALDGGCGLLAANWKSCFKMPPTRCGVPHDTISTSPHKFPRVSRASISSPMSLGMMFVEVARTPGALTDGQRPGLCLRKAVSISSISLTI